MRDPHAVSHRDANRDTYGESNSDHLSYRNAVA